MSEIPEAKTKARRKQAEQDQQIANDITAALTLMETTRDDADLQTELAPMGYDEASLDEAIENLHAPAQAAYEARAAAMGKADSAQDLLDEAVMAERQDFTDYREISRAIFTEPADKTALGLKGTLVKDLQKFLTAAKASYSAGKKAPYTEKLTKRGYSPARIDAELAGKLGVRETGGQCAKSNFWSPEARRRVGPSHRHIWWVECDSRGCSDGCLSRLISVQIPRR